MQLASCQDVNTGVKSCPVVQTKNWKLIKLARLSYRRRLGGNGRDENLLWYIFRFLSGVSKSVRLLTFWFKILFPDVPPVFHTQFSEQTLREGSVVFLIFPHFHKTSRYLISFAILISAFVHTWHVHEPLIHMSHDLHDHGSNSWKRSSGFPDLCGQWQPTAEDILVREKSEYQKS